MKTFEEILQIYKSYKPKPVDKELVEKFLNSETRYAFGMSSYTLEIAEKLRIDYITDSKAKNGDGDFCGIPIIALDDIPKDAVVLAIVIGSYETVYKMLKEKGFQSIFLYDLLNYDSDYIISRLSDFNYFKKDFEKHIDKYKNVYNELHDDVSKKTFEDIVLFRLTIDPEFVQGYYHRADEQYFEDFLNLQEGEVFVDCGGFGGETSDVFVKKCPKYAYVYIFEPLDEIENAKKLLGGHPNIEFIKKGVWDKSETLKFHVSGMASNITNYGGNTIEVVSLDNTISKKVTLIKMDVECAELNALKGAENIIKRDRPKLAICVYHRPDDWWQIFDYVKSIRPDYKIYLRHYSGGLNETVMFFV